MWLSERDMDAAGVRLFCLPHAGSGSAGFYQWKRVAPASVAICPVMLPGREGRLAESSLECVQHIVEGVHHAAEQWLDRPYAIFGHSMGALLAYEWARKLQVSGLRQPEYLFVSGRNAPQITATHTTIHSLKDEEMLRELALRYGGAQDELLASAELRALFLPILRADLTVVETYLHEGEHVVDCPVMALAGEDDRSVSDMGLRAWKEVAGGRFSVQRFAGDHFYHLGIGRSALLHVLVEHLAYKA